MISAQDLYTKYVGQKVGTNDSDTGQCVGWFNVGIREQLGLGGYVIQGAYGAKDLLSATNTRPDLIEQVWNNPNDLNQIPSPGDWVVWGASLPGSGGYGHVALFMDHPTHQLLTADQNWGGQTVHQVTHDWNYIIGWVHMIVPAPIETPVDPHLQQIADLQAQTTILTTQVADLQKVVTDTTSQLKAAQEALNTATEQISSLEAENKALKAQLELAKSDTDNLNAFGVALKWLLIRIGVKNGS